MGGHVMLFDRFSFREREGGLPEEESVGDLAAEGRGYSFTFNTRQLVLLIAGYCFLCVLVFSLGVVIGRAGTQPEATIDTTSTQATLSPEPPANISQDSRANSRIPLVPEATPKGQPGREPAFTFSPLPPEAPPTEHGDNPSTVARQTPPPPAPEVMRSSEPPALASRPEDKRDAEVRRAELTSPRPKEMPVPRPISVPQGGDFTIQVSSFRSLDQASDLKGRLSKKGYAAYVQSVDLQDRGTWHRVRIGTYRDKDGAERVANDLRSRESLPATVMKR
jgi:cell division septation protein DedD